MIDHHNILHTHIKTSYLTIVFHSDGTERLKPQSDWSLSRSLFVTRKLIQADTSSYRDLGTRLLKVVKYGHCTNLSHYVALLLKMQVSWYRNYLISCQSRGFLLQHFPFHEGPLPFHELSVVGFTSQFCLPLPDWGRPLVGDTDVYTMLVYL